MVRWMRFWRAPVRSRRSARGAMLLMVVVGASAMAVLPGCGGGVREVYRPSPPTPPPPPPDPGDDPGDQGGSTLPEPAGDPDGYGFGEDPVHETQPVRDPRPQPTRPPGPIAAASPVPSATENPGPATVGTPPGPEPDGSRRVRVFYGTDRSRVVAAAGTGRVGTFALATLGLLAISAGLGFAGRRSPRRMILWSGTFVGVLATGGSAVLALWELAPQASPTGGTPLQYGNDRGVLELGFCDVTIPPGHVPGEMERPSIFRFELSEDAGKHVVIRTVERMEEAAFHRALRERVAQSAEREAFVFIHGYNVTFESAARRTAQLAFDLGFDGAPIFYSWPSQGGLFR